MTDDARPVLFGEAPSRAGDRYHGLPLSGPPARVLCQLAGIPPVEGGSTYGKWTWALYDAFECRNVFDRYRDATPWSAPAARSRLVDVLDEVYGRVVVCLGRRPQKALADALGAPVVDLGVWRRSGEILHVATLHPSGLNRSLNDADERNHAGAVLRCALELARVRTRLWRLAAVGTPADCWIWQGSDNGVYGDYQDGKYGRRQGAHRWAWEVSYGPLAAGMCALHRCDTPLCVNPAHLFEGTLADNNADMVAKGRARPGPGARYRSGIRNPTAKLTDAQVAEIRASDESGIDVAKRLGVSRSLVSQIRTGKHRSLAE